MRAIVFHGVGDVRLDDVKEPKIKEPTDAIVRLTASAICGTDLHMIRGTMAGMKPGTIMGHEGVGVVEECGKAVRNFKKGERVVIPSTIGCGYCSYCRAGYFAQCDVANPNGKEAGTAFFGGPAPNGPFDGLQAEFARVPYAAANLYKIPDEVADEQAILLSDIFPTSYFGAEMTGVKPGNTVAVFGCGPVGQLAIASLKHMGAGRIFAVDCIPSRLDVARGQGAEAIDFNAEDPIATLKELTGGIGPDRAIDAVGVDAMSPQGGPGRKAVGKAEKKAFEEEVSRVAPKTKPDGDNWHPGDAPSMALTWAVTALAKAGTLSIVGVYPHQAKTFPIGLAMNKNLTVRMGNCNHRRYLPLLVELVRTGAVDPSKLLSQHEPIGNAIEAYKEFDRREPGWVKVELRPQVH
ncbi:MAG: zinc-dependent alcohol dehydrogenase [Myxococcales bacterium]